MMPAEESLRRHIVRVGRLLYEKGLIAASEGNISARLDTERLLITPSGLHTGLLAPDQLLLIDREGTVLASPGRGVQPSSELAMHLEAYRQRPDIAAVVHAHPPVAIALSIAGISFDNLLAEMVVFLGEVPTVPYATPSSEESAHAIHIPIRDHDALIIERHGAVTVGDSPMQAFMRLEMVEQSARIAFMLAQLGVENPLPAHEVRKLQQRKEQENGA